MGYDAYDWFDTEYRPALLKALKENEALDLDGFFDLFKRLFYSPHGGAEGFKKRLFWLLMEEDGEISDHVKKCFEYISDFKEIISLEYNNNGDKIRCDFNAIKDDD